MSVVVDVSSRPGRLPIPRATAVRAARTALRSRRVSHAELSIAFVSNRTIARLNARYLGRRGATDVIAFGLPAATPAGPLVGDVYIAPDVARRSARERHITLREELVRLVVHGTLHVSGLDHPSDDSRTGSPMWALQEHLVRRVLRRTVR